MALDNWEEAVRAIGLPVGDPQFFPRLFTGLSKRLKVQRDNVLERVSVKEYDGLSRHFAATGIQEPCAARNNLRTRRLAQLLINDKGFLDLDILDQLIAILKKQLYPLGPGRQHDMVRQEHILSALVALKERKELQRQLKSITKPFANPQADQLIRDTLQLENRAAVTDMEARRAALSAWLCYLRQSVGSCFATAPAIIVHDEQVEQFFRDIRDLLNTGQLKRTFAGTQYTVPLSRSWGAGDLKKSVVGASDIEKMPYPIWESPGLLVAFTAAGVVDETLPLSERIGATRKTLERLFAKEKNPFFFTRVDRILEDAILHKVGLTQEELKNYENRPPTLFSSVVAPIKAQKGSLEGRCHDYYDRLDKAYRAFKALTDNALLKAWEFTVASFAEVKANLARYNFYSSLGLNAEDEGGIGSCVYRILKDRLDEANRQTHELNDIYEQMYMQVKHFEGRMQRASSEKELRWLKMEYRNRLSDFKHHEALRNESAHRAKRLANLFNVLIDIYDKKFVEHFQEVYDADIVEVSGGPYDDSPAGFRLLYKAGRATVTQWDRINTPSQFVDALVGFFVGTEREITDSPELEGLEEDVAHIITSIVTHVKSKEFLETAFHRMARAHKAPLVENPLENLEKVEKKPWVYTSGGTMGSLVSSYFGRESQPSEVSRWVESPTELCAFLIDTIKQMPDLHQHRFLEEQKGSLLMHSPTHAFLLKPSMNAFSEAWQTETYSYTWIRDNYIAPAEQFYGRLSLDEEMIHLLLKHLGGKLPEAYRASFKEACRKLPRRMRPSEFHRQVSYVLASRPFNRPVGGFVVDETDVDSLLYELLPMMNEERFKQSIQEILNDVLGQGEGGRLLPLFESILIQTGHSRVYTAKDLREMCLSLIMIDNGATSLSRPYSILVAQSAQIHKLAMPAPLLFGDTNWAKDFFGFVVNPGNGDFELWRLDITGTEGIPMRAWDQWLDGSRQDRQWGIYNRPHEYRSI